MAGCVLPCPYYKRHVFRIIASVFGIGYVKGGGTAAAIVCCLVLYLTRFSGVSRCLLPAALLTVGLLAAGTLAAQQVEPRWGKDNYRVVIDELAGMWISMLFIPLTGIHLLAGLVLFRFFDIVKPFYIRHMEKLPGGVGVMMDDVLAGIYANILLQVAIKINLF